MNIEQIIAALGLVGISGIIPAIVAYFISSRKRKTDAKQELKEKRYKAILLLCYTFVHYEKEKSKLIINRPNITSKKELFSELEAEWVNMSLYASDTVIKAMKTFLEIKNHQAFTSLIISMRKDLFGIKSKLTPEIFDL